jgi:citrate/tricarballylate utilization protein
VLALAIGALRFWRDVTPGCPSRRRGCRSRAQRAGTHLPGRRPRRRLQRGGRRFTLARRRFHHLTFYGFMLCFAATCVATLYHYAGWEAPYALTSLPVLLGTLGGIGLLVGPAGLLWLNLRRHPLQGDPRSARWTAASSRCCC